MIFTLTVQQISSVTIFAFTATYSSLGVSDYKVLNIAHGVIFAMIVLLNLAVLYKFKKCFRLIEIKDHPKRNEESEISVDLSSDNSAKVRRDCDLKHI